MLITLGEAPIITIKIVYIIGVDFKCAWEKLIWRACIIIIRRTTRIVCSPFLDHHTPKLNFTCPSSAHMYVTPALHTTMNMPFLSDRARSEQGASGKQEPLMSTRSLTQERRKHHRRKTICESFFFFKFRRWQRPKFDWNVRATIKWTKKRREILLPLLVRKKKINI
jgi:hypothetical protein